MTVTPSPLINTLASIAASLQADIARKDDARIDHKASTRELERVQAALDAQLALEDTMLVQS